MSSSSPSPDAATSPTPNISQPNNLTNNIISSPLSLSLNLASQYDFSLSPSSSSPPLELPQRLLTTPLLSSPQVHSSTQEENDTHGINVQHTSTHSTPTCVELISPVVPPIGPLPATALSPTNSLGPEPEPHINHATAAVVAAKSNSTIACPTQVNQELLLRNSHDAQYMHNPPAAAAQTSATAAVGNINDATAHTPANEASAVLPNYKSLLPSPCLLVRSVVELSHLPDWINKILLLRPTTMSVGGERFHDDKFKKYFLLACITAIEITHTSVHEAHLLAHPTWELIKEDSETHRALHWHLARCHSTILQDLWYQDHSQSTTNDVDRLDYQELA